MVAARAGSTTKATPTYLRTYGIISASSQWRLSTSLTAACLRWLTSRGDPKVWNSIKHDTLDKGIIPDTPSLDRELRSGKELDAHIKLTKGFRMDGMQIGRLRILLPSTGLRRIPPGKQDKPSCLCMRNDSLRSVIWFSNIERARARSGKLVTTDHLLFQEQPKARRGSTSSYLRPWQMANTWGNDRLTMIPPSLSEGPKSLQTKTQYLVFPALQPTSCPISKRLDP